MPDFELEFEFLELFEIYLSPKLSIIEKLTL